MTRLVMTASSYLFFNSRVATPSSFFFFFNDTATTEIYTLSLHDALPISFSPSSRPSSLMSCRSSPTWSATRSEEHTSELQSLAYLVCRLLLEKKKKYQQLIQLPLSDLL